MHIYFSRKDNSRYLIRVLLLASMVLSLTSCNISVSTDSGNTSENGSSSDTNNNDASTSSGTNNDSNDTDSSNDSGNADSSGNSGNAEGSDTGSGGDNQGGNSDSSEDNTDTGSADNSGDNSDSDSASGSDTSGSDDTDIQQCQAYEWPGYTPDLNYNFRDEYSDIDPNTFDVYLGCDPSLVAGYKSSGWYTFIWGYNRNPAITDADIDRVLANLNEDMAYTRDVMGWPPDKLPREGYYSNIYLYGSGLCTDNAANTEKGGWQSGINGYPMILLSYYPVITPSERGGITHEEIHAVMASMPSGKAAWFNEGGNTWLQMNMEASRTGQYGVGFLDGAPFLAPHMPIENYSGWLQDGTFGGPNAEGVNRFVNGQQVSTWRDYLGGNQYNSVFSHFLSLYVSTGANAWIWSNGNYNHILETLASGLGEEQTRDLVMEYRARQAMVDFGAWTDALKVPINNNWGRTIGAEAISGGILQQPTPHKLTFYADSDTVGSVVIPATDTLPGWSGANQIPFVTNGDTVKIKFDPQDENMRLQLAYRAADGSAVYSKPVSSGEVCLTLDKPAKDGTVVAVVSNVDYLYQGESSRSRKYNYQLEMVEGVSGTADIYQRHY
ncbi:hypothetical protein [Gynuella sunshinyii]|uniref:Cobalamin biosynthesis protein CobT (Nicotinate-mononucleotide:5, 6-dimethylbenzimidazole phosphoribosyltransferase) n=1 Tax=Gynuella sunshinyii YC6258 TaxID=1445510 RepID=A0A0C5VSM7_9GAMM|nr:hypothetical protein [Gynuella sunshinyii]AJQ97211.1 cobalamin biosynthesis protein CobT (nicotinate-mononucleotide:5, 6-dimethylbenzimidazole phosphoribosyltransferase) [Gynuella sunshinyii YC6258]